MLPAAFVFDFDGTLVDTETAEYESVRLVWADHGLHYPVERWHPYVGTMQSVPWVDELRDALGGNGRRAGAGAGDRDRDAALRRQARRYNHELLSLVQPRPGVNALLAAASEMAVPMGIASNAPSDWVEQHLRRLALIQFFDAIVTVDRVERGKPHPEPYLTACVMLDADPRRSVAFEDSSTGLQAALAAGMYAVAVPGPMSDGHDLGDADELLSSLEDVTVVGLGAAVAARSPSS